MIFMSGHGMNRHLKRLAKSKAVPIPAKGRVYLKKPCAGAHAAAQSIGLSTLLTSVLKIADNNLQAKRLLSAGEILVDGRPVKDEAFGVGIMDVISIPKMKKNFRVVALKGILRLLDISDAEALQKYCRVMNKTAVGKGKIQLNLHDGRCLLSSDSSISTGDSLKLSVPSQKIESVIKLVPGATCYVFRGRHSGMLAKLKEVIIRPGSKPADAVLTYEGGEFITLENYLFAVDDQFKVA